MARLDAERARGALACVTPDEGVGALANIVDGDLHATRIGLHAAVCCKAADDGAMVPMFTPRD